MIASVLSINNSIIAPTINLDNPEFDLNFVPNKAINKQINYVMSNSFGFGGHNAVLIAKKYA